MGNLLSTYRRGHAKMNLKKRQYNENEAEKNWVVKPACLLPPFPKTKVEFSVNIPVQILFSLMIFTFHILEKLPHDKNSPSFKLFCVSKHFRHL